MEEKETMTPTTCKRCSGDSECVCHSTGRGSCSLCLPVPKNEWPCNCGDPHRPGEHGGPDVCSPDSDPTEKVMREFDKKFVDVELGTTNCIKLKRGGDGAYCDDIKSFLRTALLAQRIAGAEACLKAVEKAAVEFEYDQDDFEGTPYERRGHRRSVEAARRCVDSIRGGKVK